MLYFPKKAGGGNWREGDGWMEFFRLLLRCRVDLPLILPYFRTRLSNISSKWIIAPPCKHTP